MTVCLFKTKEVREKIRKNHEVIQGFCGDRASALEKKLKIKEKNSSFSVVPDKFGTVLFYYTKNTSNFIYKINGVNNIYVVGKREPCVKIPGKKNGVYSVRIEFDLGDKIEEVTMSYFQNNWDSLVSEAGAARYCRDLAEFVLINKDHYTHIEQESERKDLEQKAGKVLRILLITLYEEYKSKKLGEQYRAKVMAEDLAILQGLPQ